MAASQEPSTVIERRLRPIYDHLEVGNNRKALQETDKLLKKQPNLLCARALKGLALLRLGRVDESINYLQNAAEEKPVDDSTLQVLSFCYKELEQLDKIVELYAYAVKQNPGNEDLLAHLFKSYVRMEDFKAQQSVALQLYKLQPKNAYYFWAVISVVLQGVRGPESGNLEKRKLFLTLAQRMVDKHIAEDKLESEQEVNLYVHILKLQNKWQEALDFLQGPVCQKLYPGVPVYMKIDLMKLLEQWSEINTLLKDLLKEEPDRWDYYQDYLSSCFKLYSAQSNNMDVLAECHKFLCEFIEDGAKKKVRGPYMARLEMHKRMRAESLDATAMLGDFCDLIAEYFGLFGDKSCCTHDITLFLPSITLEERKQLASRLLLESGITSTALPQNKEQMLKHICALQISRICGSHIDLETDHLLAFYTALKLHYEHGKSSFGQNLLPTDMGPSDPYALLAANVMWDVSLQEGKSDRLFEALCLLQYVLRNSTSNFHVKLLSLKIYHMLGCTLGAQEMYEYLDIKQIQLDSMGYIHCNLLPSSGRFSMSRNCCDSTLKFFTNSYKERLEYIALAYRFCTFSKLEEFMNFKDRLTNSLHYVAMTIEAQLCDLVILYGNYNQNLDTYLQMSIDPVDDRIAWNDLTDNRDLSAIVHWDPLHLVCIEEERKNSFDQEIELLQIRSLMLRLVASMLDLFNPTAKHISLRIAAATAAANKGQKPPKDSSTMELLLESWLGLFGRLRQMNYMTLSNRFLVNLIPTRLHLMLDMPYQKFFADLVQLVMDLYTGESNLPMQCKVVSDNVTELSTICAGVIKESNEATNDGLWRRREWQQKVAMCLEILCLFTFLLSVFHEKMQTLSNNKAKPKRRNNEKNDSRNLQIHEKERLQLITELMRHLKIKFQAIDAALRTWNVPALPRDINTFMADMSLKPEVESTLIGDVASVFKESHELMIIEMKNLIKDKIRMLNYKSV